MQLDRVAVASEGECIRVVALSAVSREVETVALALRDAGMNVSTHDDLASVRAHIERHAPDIVIVGTALRDASTATALRELSQWAREERSTLMALVDHADLAEEAMLFGASEVAARTISAVELVARVRATVHALREIRRLEAETIRLARENTEMRSRLVHDPLTGLINRRHFEKRLAEEVERAYRYGQPLTVVALDLDRFAPLERAAGDCVLQSAATALLRCARQVDVVARLEDETFAIIAPATPETGARVFAERVRAMLERATHDSDVAGGALSITASLGVACLVPTLAAPIVDAQALLERAETAIAHAKSAGGNRVGVVSGG